MVFSAPATLTVRISRFYEALVDQPDPALLLKSDRVRDQPVTRSPRRRARQTRSPLQDAREGYQGVAAQTRRRATPQTTSSTPSSAHACLCPAMEVLILVAAWCVTSVRNARAL